MHPQHAGPRFEEIVRGAGRIEADLGGVALDVGELERVLVGEQQVVHRPERGLGAGRLRGLGGQRGVGVDVTQRQVAEDVAQPPASGGKSWSCRVPPALHGDICARVACRGIGALT